MSIQLTPWRELVEPHSDVLKGTFKQAEFAADISRVHAGEATAEYQNPALFFQRTFITEGMKLLLHSVLQRISNQGGDPVIQLQTAFGGGKTHSLLAVYHLATATCQPSELQGVPPLLDACNMTELPKARVAVIDGIRLSPNQAVKRGPCMVHTLWGELAYQLAGTAGYMMIEASDKAGTSPGKEVLEQLLTQAAPCVILMDELVAYMRQFSEVSLSGGTFSSNLSFMQALTEAIKGVHNAILLASLPESAKEAGDIVGQRALETLAHTFGRVQALWKPVEAEEAFEIVRRRLFATVKNRPQADAVCKSFTDFYIENSDKFPPETQESRYAGRMRAAYPIHPEVFDRLYEDWSSLDNFQRTRGVLKFMAKVIHRLWKDGNNDPLIMPGNMPLYDNDARGDILYYLPQGWDPVVDKDIDGENAQPTQLDTENTRFGAVQACRRVARTIFLGSAPSESLGEGNIYRGIDDKRIYLGASLPPASLALFRDAISRLQDKLYYLNSGNEKYWFNVRPNLRREMEERQNRFDTKATLPFIRKTLQSLLGRNLFDAIHIFTESSDVPDDEQLRLVVLPPRNSYSKTISNDAEAVAYAMVTKKGENPRSYRNRIICLAAEYDSVPRLIGQIKSYLAWDSIVQDSQNERLVLDTLQVKNAQKAATSALQVAQTSVQETFKWLLVPYCKRTDVNTMLWDKISLAHGNSKLIDEIERQLKENEYVITSWAPVHLASELKQWVWKNNTDFKPALKVWQDMCQYCYFPRLKNRKVFADTLCKGTESQDFFGVAQGVDEGSKFLGFVFGKSYLVMLDSSTLIISREYAEKYNQALLAEQERILALKTKTQIAEPMGHYGSDKGSSEQGADTTNSAGDANNAGSSTEENGAQTKKINELVKQFFGHVALDPMTGKSEIQTIYDEIISHFAERGDTKVLVSLEIRATTDAENGFPSDLQRTVKENCTTLKFDFREFEK